MTAPAARAEARRLREDAAEMLRSRQDYGGLSVLEFERYDAMAALAEQFERLAGAAARLEDTAA